MSDSAAMLISLVSPGRIELDHGDANGLMAAASCSHLDGVLHTELPEPLLGCEECLRSGSWWVHLRMCLACGKVGCCDSSPNKHATAHFHESGHPLVRSAETGEDWSWCYVDEIAFVTGAR